MTFSVFQAIRSDTTRRLNLATRKTLVDRRNGYYFIPLSQSLTEITFALFFVAPDCSVSNKPKYVGEDLCSSPFILVAIPDGKFVVLKRKLQRNQSRDIVLQISFRLYVKVRVMSMRVRWQGRPTQLHSRTINFSQLGNYNFQQKFLKNIAIRIPHFVRHVSKKNISS